LFDLAIPTSFFPFPSFHRQANKYNLHQAIHNHLNPETMVSLREDEDQTNNTSRFLINQQTGNTPFSYPTISHDHFTHKYGFNNLSPYFPDFPHCPISLVTQGTNLRIPADWGDEGVGVLTPLIRGRLTSDILERINLLYQVEFVLPFIAQTSILRPSARGYTQSQNSQYNTIVSIGKITISIQKGPEEYEDTQAGWQYGTQLRKQLLKMNRGRIQKSPMGYPFSEPQTSQHQINLPNRIGRIEKNSHESILTTPYRVTTTVLTMYQTIVNDPDNEYFDPIVDGWQHSQGVDNPNFDSFPDLEIFLNQHVENGLSLIEFVLDTTPNPPPEFLEPPNDASSVTERNSVRPLGAPMAMDRNQRVWNGRTDIGMSVVQDWLPRAVAHHSHPNPLWDNIRGGN